MLAIAAPAAAHEVKIGTLELTDLWTRATPPGAPAGGGFLTITNSGDAADRLIAVSTGASNESELHEMAVVDGVMTMRELANGIEIPAHGSVTLAPGVPHVHRSEGAARRRREAPVTLSGEAAIDTFLHTEPIGAKGMKAAAWITARWITAPWRLAQ